MVSVGPGLHALLDSVEQGMLVTSVVGVCRWGRISCSRLLISYVRGDYQSNLLTGFVRCVYLCGVYDSVCRSKIVG